MRTRVPIIFFTLTFLLMLSITAFAQSGSDKDNYRFKGQLIDADSGIAVTFAHITNLTKGTVVVSTNDGAFVMPVSGGDSLMVTRVGYFHYKMAVPAKASQEVLIILMQPKTEQLQEVVIGKFPTEARLKEQILALELPDNSIKLQLPPPVVEPRTDPNDPKDVTLVAIPGAISGFANKFNNKERGRQFKARMAVEEQREAYIASKFNRDIVQQITGIKADEELNEFMKFCVLPEDFLYKANTYQIHDAVLGCFKEFVASR